MSEDHVATTASSSPRSSRTALQTLREALQLFWTVADRYAKRRLLLALALVAAGALLAALTPIALKLVIDSLSQKDPSGPAYLAPLTLLILYALGQYLWRCSTELRMMVHGHAKQRVRRHIGRRLFEHLVRLPLRFHLEHKTGAMGETAEQGGDSSRSPSNARATRGELVFDEVSFCYRQERVVLKGVSFAVPAGRTVAVVGVSGSGKSSLIRLLFRLHEPDHGRILLDGVPVVDMSLSAVRQAIAVVPQDTVLFHDTIANNIGFGRNGSTQLEIEEAARLANLHEFIAGLPEGYETLIGERGLKLSGGERQRVAIARGTLKRPRIFVFDEATSPLDSRTEREILRNLLDLSSRSTTLVIAHRLSTVVHADEILVLDHGVIVERGTHDELRARNGCYAALWNAQQAGTSEGSEIGASVA